MFKQKYYFSSKKITLLGLGLAMLILSQIISSILPSLPNGLGSVFILFDLMIIIYSFIFGIFNTLFLGLIFYGVIGWFFPSIFMSGIIYAKTWEYILFIYIFDYVLPFCLLSLSSLIYKLRPKFFWAFFNTILMVSFCYLSYVISGVIFWGSFAWEGWNVWTYALVANSIRSSILLFMTLILLKPVVQRLNLVIKLDKT